MTAVFALASHPLARIPDPSIGFQAGREAFGDERIVRVVCPESAAACKSAGSWRRRVRAEISELAPREQSGEAQALVAGLQATARYSGRAWAFARTARVAQRAFSLGEPDNFVAGAPAVAGG